MKRFAKVMAVVMAVSALFSMTALAANKESLLAFSSNGTKKDSDYWTKPNDEDPYGYCTTVSKAEGITSTVFTHGGTVYSRIYLKDSSTARTEAWKFTTNTKGGPKLYVGGPNYRKSHFLRAEIENTKFTGPGEYQGFLWCP